MLIPPRVVLTRVPQPGGPVGRISIRIDTILVADRGIIQFEEPVTRGVSVKRASGQAEGTILHLAGGVQVVVEESPEEVDKAIHAASPIDWMAILLACSSWSVLAVAATIVYRLIRMAS